MRAVIAIIALVVLGAMGIWGLQASLVNAAEDRTIQNETFVPDAGNVTTLEFSSMNHTWYGDDVTVYDENGTLMNNQTDYLWHPSNGTITTLSGGELAGDAEAKITYTFAQTTESQRQLAQIPNLIPIILALFVFLLPLVMLLKVLG